MEEVEINLHQLLVPISHLASSIPKWSIHPDKITPSLFFQSGLEILASYRVRSNNVEISAQFRIQLMVPSYVVAKV